MTFDIVAHRGVPEDAPEKTLAAFERAIHLGALYDLCGKFFSC